MRVSGCVERGRLRLTGFVALVLLVPGALPVAAAGPFVRQELAEGVHLFRPAEDSVGRTNSLVVEQQTGLVVVEAQPTPAAARELLAAIREVSDSPVRYLVLSHPHAESAGGASAFPSTTVVVSSTGCLEALKDPAHDLGAEVRALAEDPAAWVEPERRLPTLVLFARTALDDPVRRVELLPIGQTHSQSDMMVHLPQADVMYAGSLLFTDGNPYAADGEIANWLSALNQLVRQSPRVTVGLRGEPIPVEELRKQREALAWLKGQVASVFIDRPPLEDVPGLILAAEGFDERFDPEGSFVPIVIDRAIQHALEARYKRGLTYP